MISAFLVGAVLLGAEPEPVGPVATPEDRAAYDAARDQVGRDADANVRLALWCEAHGLAAERVAHLARAVLSDPSHAVARGLLGMVSYGGRWTRPEQAAARAQEDQALQTALAEYNRRRDGMAETADAHWALANWCDQAGLKAEAIAHYTAVTRLDPNHAEAWARLGCRKVGNRWLSEAQIKADKAEANAQNAADVKWRTRLRLWWKEWLAADPEGRFQLEQDIAQELEPRAVPSIRSLLSTGTAQQQQVAVRMYERIDSPQATRDLAHLAILDHHPDTRQGAIEALTHRDPREVMEPLVGLMHKPIEVAVAPGSGQGDVAAIRVEDETSILRKFYVQKTERVVLGPGRLNFGFLGPVLNPRNSRTATTARQELASDLLKVEARNHYRREVNESARVALAELTGADQGSDPESWRRWLSDQKGYAYERPQAPKRVITRVSQHTQYQIASVGFHSNCFARGTLVKTLLGPTPIESLRVGDQVVAADTSTGALSYQPIVVVYHNPPSPTLRIKLAGDELVATPIHRFWRVGKGWTLARDLKAGDTLRVLGGSTRVAAVEADVVQPVYNLEVAQGQSFFVGANGALVHDNSPLKPGSEPFDAPPVLASVASRTR